LGRLGAINTTLLTLSVELVIPDLELQNLKGHAKCLDLWQLRVLTCP